VGAAVVFIAVLAMAIAATAEIVTRGPSPAGVAAHLVAIGIWLLMATLVGSKLASWRRLRRDGPGFDSHG
jgi:hypothetical protein